MLTLSNEIKKPIRKHINNNTVLLGGPGSGKTRSCVMPTLLSASGENYLILDPKGELEDCCKETMIANGYSVKRIDFQNPYDSDLHFNPLTRCQTEQDIMKLSSILMEDQKNRCVDIFWGITGSMLLNAVVSYLVKYRPAYQQTLHSVLKLLNASNILEESTGKTKLDKIFEEAKGINPNSFALEQYNAVRCSADKTFKSIVISSVASFTGFLTDGIKDLTSYDDIDAVIDGFASKDHQAVFVRISDINRTNVDKLTSLFIQQFIDGLYRRADSSPKHCLKTPCVLMLDDVGPILPTIKNLNCLISTSRGRNISFVLILQSLGQIKEIFPKDYTSILSGCANIAYFSSNDLETAKEFSERLNLPLSEVLYKSTDSVYVFEEGTSPKLCNRYNFESDRHIADYGTEMEL